MTALHRNAYRWLADEPQHRTGIAVLQRAIGAALLFRVFTEGPFASFLWGPNGVGYGSMASVMGPLGIFLDLFFLSEIGTRLILVALAVAAAGLLFQRSTRLATFVTLATFTMIMERLPDLGDGGDNITSLVLIYLLFALPAGRAVRQGALSVWIHNVAVLAIGAQLAVLYFTSGFMKMNGSVWHHGTALYQISQVEWFSIPATRTLFKNPAFATVATYSTMLFQVWFPVGVLSPLRLPFIAVGIMFHIGIAVSMGLLTFSTVMIGLELFLVTDEEYRRLGAFVSRLATRIRAARPAPSLVLEKTS